MRKIIKKQTDLSLDKLSEALKNPPQNVYVSVYTKNEVEVEPVKKSSERVTLKQIVEMINRLDSKVDAGFEQVNTRLDYIVKANNLKDLPKTK